VACIDYGKTSACGICVKDCGAQTNVVCNTFGYTNPAAKCQTSAAGGGGRCGKDSANNKTFVCCVVSKLNNQQAVVPPDSNGICQIVNPFPTPSG
jgi:hypothetical protein